MLFNPGTFTAADVAREAQVAANATPAMPAILRRFFIGELRSVFVWTGDRFSNPEEMMETVGPECQRHP
jgi:hypothetical protein